jgi:hypothetical protein
MLRHLEEVTFAESTIELCDDKPSNVELQGNQLRRRTLLSVGSYDSRRRLTIGSGPETVDLGLNLAAGSSVRDPKRPQGTTMKHCHSPEAEHRRREAALDETLSATFPASDPPSTLPNPDDHSVDAGSSVKEQDSGTPPPSAQT